MPRDPRPPAADDDATRPAGHQEPLDVEDEDRTVLDPATTRRPARPSMPLWSDPPRGISAKHATESPHLSDSPPEANEDGTRSPAQVPTSKASPTGFARFTRAIVLGYGRKTTVFKVHDPKRGANIAVKLLNMAPSQDEHCREAFLRSARAASAVTHPNIVAIHEVGIHEGQPYVAMDLVGGESLAHRLEHPGEWSVQDVVRVALEITSAVASAHRVRFAHGGLRPSAVLLERPNDVVRVTDFGMAAVDGYGSSPPSATESAGLVRRSTVEGDLELQFGIRDDVHAIGSMLYRLLAGQEAQSAQHQERGGSGPTPASALARLRPDAPSELVRVVDRCFASDPEQQFASAVEVVLALEQVRSAAVAEPASAPQSTAPPPLPATRAATPASPFPIAIAVASASAVVSALFCAAIVWTQVLASSAHAVDQGAAIARYFARHAAGAALAEDWEAVDVSIQELIKTGDFTRVAVADLQGVVRASSDGGLVGQRTGLASGEVVYQRPGSIVVRRLERPSGTELAFETPLLFQDQAVGRATLGLSSPSGSGGRGTIAWSIAWAVIVSLTSGLSAYLAVRRAGSVSKTSMHVD